MSFEQSGTVSLGNLLRAGVSLYTSEAVALVAEVCRQVFYASELQTPEVEGILVRPDGSVTMSSTGPVVTTEEQMAALASLLEALLPPLGSSEPDYAVRASLRMLAPRARGREGLAPILAPEGLAAELSQFATTDPVAVLRHLWIRADRALHQYLAPIGSEDRVVAAVARRSVDAGEAPPPLVDLPLVSSVEGLDEPSARSSDSRPRRLLARVAFSVAAALLLVLGFVSGDWLGKHSYADAARSATADLRRSSVTG